MGLICKIFRPRNWDGENSAFRKFWYSGPRNSNWLPRVYWWFILQEILIPLEKLLENIKLLKDSHTEFFLFQNCATLCKIAFLLRTLPPAQGDFLMKGYESRMKDFLKHLVKIQHDLPELAWFQASLQFCLGGTGLGLQVAKQHHEAAFAASLIQCKFWLDQVCSQQVNIKVNSLILQFTSSLRSRYSECL